MVERLRKDFESYLQDRVETIYPDDSVLHQACRYAMAGEGKRVRPLLTLLCADLCGSNDRFEIYEAALAIEFVHTYSLVHDDLPAMDNDDYRRGRPSTHKAFGEDLAILVGDALLTDAFYLLSQIQSAKAVQTIALLAWAAGSGGMVLGQALDIKNVDGCPLSLDELTKIHNLKTGRLFAASCGIAALLANLDQNTVQQFTDIGKRLGLVFQIQDDLLDSQSNTGKSSGKDIAQEKTTFASLYTRYDLEDLLDTFMRDIEKHFLKYAAKDHKIFELLNRLECRKK